jgi:hypothetical protein
LDTLYGHLSNLSQETAMILPEGYELEFVVPSGSPEVFKNLIDYIDKEISLVICGEDEAGQAEAGSRASSQVANTIRVVRASEMSEMLSQTLTQTLVRWIVDLNFGIDVAAPVLTREFRIEESPLTMPDVSLLIQSGYTPRKEWIERHFRVELEQKSAEGEQQEDTGTTFDPEQDKDLFNSIFGGDASGTTGAPGTQQQEAAQADLNAAAAVTAEEPGATPEESQADAIPNPAPTEQLSAPETNSPEEKELSDQEILALLGLSDEEETPESTKPFGNQKISEDEAVEMDK